jgi:hypothetical protein
MDPSQDTFISSCDELFMVGSREWRGQNFTLAGWKHISGSVISAALLSASLSGDLLDAHGARMGPHPGKIELWWHYT